MTRRWLKTKDRARGTTVAAHTPPLDAQPKPRAMRALLGALAIWALSWHPALFLIWNLTASAPLGLYRIASDGPIRPTDVAATWVPPAFRRFAETRRYLAPHVPLIKTVAAARGDIVCAHGPQIRVNGGFVARRRARDGQRRPLPAWQGCVALKPGEIFLLSANPAAFDGRYFGVTGPRDIIGKAIALWHR